MFAFMILLRFTGQYGPNVLYLNFSATAFQEPCDFKDEPYIKIPIFGLINEKGCYGFVCSVTESFWGLTITLPFTDGSPKTLFYTSMPLHTYSHIHMCKHARAHTRARIYLIYPHLPSLPNLGKITLPHMALLSWFWGVLQEWVRNEKVEWVEPIRMSWCPGSHQVPLRLLELWALPWFVCLLFCFLKEHGTPPFFSNRK